jgi:hypothetical protein
MKTEIDFLRGTRGEREKRAKFLRMVKTGSILALLAYCLVLAAFFSYSFFLNSQVQKVDRETELKKERIESLKEVEVLQIALKQRLSSLSKFFDSQKGPNFPVILNYFDQLSQEINLRELTITSEGKINMSLEANSASVLERFLEKINQEETADLFSNVTLSSLDKRETGGYSLVILLEAKIKQ